MRPVDTIAYLLERIRPRRYLVYAKVSTFLTRITASLTGIQIGPKCIFYGIPILRRSPLARIEIGAECRFDSLRHKNHFALNHPCFFTVFPKAELVIGMQSGFGGTVIRVAHSVRIGNRVKIGANCKISDHEDHPEDHRSTPPRPIVIEDDVWLGMNVVVLKGVTIGKGALIGANSMVTRDIPPYSVAVGSPARVVRSLPFTNG